MNRKDRNDFSGMFEDGSDLDITLSYPEQISDKVDLNIVSDKVHVKIKKVAKDLVDQYAASDTSKEIGGVLIGSYEEINGQYHVYIEAAIKANYTDASKAEIKFTHQTWEDIDRKKEQYYPNKKIVGWFHTHPGFGVFLSDYDLFIQENFFKLAFQVAYVVDPVKNKWVFFGNVDGETVKINYEIEEIAMPANRSRPAIRAYPKKRKLKKVFRSAFIIIALITIIPLLSWKLLFNVGDKVNPNEISPGFKNTEEHGSTMFTDEDPPAEANGAKATDGEEIDNGEMTENFEPKNNEELEKMEKVELIEEYIMLREKYENRL